MCMQCMASAMTAGVAVTGIRAWVAAHRPSWASARLLKLGTAAILAMGVLASGAHLAPNGPGDAVAQAAADPESSQRARAGGGTSELWDQAVRAAFTAAKATGALEAIEGSLLYLGARYETAAESEARATRARQAQASAAPESSVDTSAPLPPASAGSNGTPHSLPPGASGEGLVAKAPEAAGSGAGGPTATYVSGIALAPPEAPERVAAAINAANTIVGRPYIWGGGHGSWYASGYDCSGAVSFALAGGGFLSSPLTSGALASWGAPGPGRWITIYASSSHAYAVIAGLRWDTVGDARGSGPRWHVAGAVPDGFVARHPPGY
jgi:cell wall-associated NlpC family hydrolase